MLALAMMTACTICRSPMPKLPCSNDTTNGVMSEKPTTNDITRRPASWNDSRTYFVTNETTANRTAKISAALNSSGFLRKARSAAPPPPAAAGAGAAPSAAGAGRRRCSHSA